MPHPAPQPVLADLTRAAIFLVVAVRPGDAAASRARALSGDFGALVRSVGSRAMDGELAAVMAFGAAVWERLFGTPKPKELHQFRELHGVHHAVATEGDILFHIRAARFDLCFELTSLVMQRLGDAVRAVDEVHGFRYFDQRDLIGFVDGTENPLDEAAIDAAIVGDEDPNFAGGSYVIVQKYLHDMAAWDALSIAEQEGVIGRTKLANVELDPAVRPASSHVASTTIEEDGVELEIVRRNMPFGNVSTGESGTYFIGYARSPRPIERMLENMFIGNPPGNYDRLLDFSRAVTGTLFFAPAAAFLEAAPTPADATHPDPDRREPSKIPPARTPDGSLGIGSLKQGGSA